MMQVRETRRTEKKNERMDSVVFYRGHGSGRGQLTQDVTSDMVSSVPEKHYSWQAAQERMGRKKKQQTSR